MKSYLEVLYLVGIHYFDLLMQAFGSPITSNVQFKNEFKAKGTIILRILKLIGFSQFFIVNQKINLNQKEFLWSIINKLFSKVDNDLHQENYRNY